MIRKVSFVTDELPAAPRFSSLFQVDDLVQEPIKFDGLLLSIKP